MCSEERAMLIELNESLQKKNGKLAKENKLLKLSLRKCRISIAEKYTIINVLKSCAAHTPNGVEIKIPTDSDKYIYIANALGDIPVQGE